MSEIKAGIYRDISIHDYHAGIGLSASNLSELARSPLHYMTSLNYPSKETPSLRLGIAVHCAILEPERKVYSHIYIVLKLYFKYS